MCLVHVTRMQLVPSASTMVTALEPHRFTHSQTLPSSPPATTAVTGLLIFGGIQDSFTMCNDMYFLDLTSLTWSKVQQNGGKCFTGCSTFWLRTYAIIIQLSLNRGSKSAVFAHSFSRQSGFAAVAGRRLLAKRPQRYLHIRSGHKPLASAPAHLAHSSFRG